MKHMKKALVTLVAAVTVATNVVGLAACGGGTKREKTDFSKDVPVVAYDGSAVTVEFYHTMGANLEAVLNKAIPKFNALYPNVTIKHDMMGDYPQLRDSLSTEIQSGYSPTMAFCYPDHVALYNEATAVVSLDGYIDSTLTATRADGTTETMGFTQAQLDDFVKGYYDEGKAYGDGKMYTLPFSKSTEVLYYNKTEFDKQGWTVPTTWDEMEALCAQIKVAYPTNVYPLGYDSEANWFITMTEQIAADKGTTAAYTSAEGERFIFNTEENRAFVEKFRGWYDNKYLTTSGLYGAKTSALFTETDPSKVRCFMSIGSSGGASYQCPDLGSDNVYPFEVGVASIPQVNPEKPKVIQQGPSVCIFKKSNPQECAAAWLFTKYLTTNVEFQAEYSMTNGYTPVILSAREHPVYREDFLDKADGNANLQATVVKKTIELADPEKYGNAFYVSPAFNGSSGARDEVESLLQICLSQKPKKDQTVQAFIAEQFQTKINYLNEMYPNK